MQSFLAVVSLVLAGGGGCAVSARSLAYYDDYPVYFEDYSYRDYDYYQPRPPRRPAQASRPPPRPNR